MKLPREISGPELANALRSEVMQSLGKPAVIYG